MTAMRITLEEFCEQWAPRGNGRYLPNKMEFNTHDFVTLAGDYSKSRFRTSFSEGGFYGSGKKWPARRWLPDDHPVMIDSGILSRSIQGVATPMDQTNITQRAGKNRKGIYKRGASYLIWTTASNGKVPGRRGASKSYAAVHNTDPKFGLYTVRKNSSRRPEHRQFIGFSPKLDNTINELFIPVLFRGFPFP
jgi:hypothetical protein